MTTPDFAAVGHGVHYYETPPRSRKKVQFFCLGDAVGAIDIGGEAPVTVVTNASNIAERTVGKLVCVATVGSEVEGVKVTRRAVGGTTS